MLDTLATAIEEHTQRGVEMSKEKFVKLGGWALILSGLLWFMGWLASSRPTYHPNAYYSLAIDRFANALVEPFFFFAPLMAGVGMAGLSLQQKVHSRLGRLALGAGALSGLGAAVLFGLGLRILQNEMLWSAWLWCLGFQFLGLAVWGIERLRRQGWQNLRLGNEGVLALLAGIWMPGWLASGIIYGQVAGKTLPWSPLLMVLILTLTSLNLMLLGYQLQSASPQAAAN